MNLKCFTLIALLNMSCELLQAGTGNPLINKIQEEPKFLGSMIVSCGPDGYPMTSFKVYEWYGTAIGKQYGPLWQNMDKALKIGEGKGCKFGGYHIGLTPEQAVSAQYKLLDKSIRKKVTSSVTGLRITTGEDGNSFVSLTKIPATMASNASGVTDNGISYSKADMSQFTNNARLGAMIIYYGPKADGMSRPSSWYVYEVRGSELSDKDGLAGVLTKKVLGTYESVGYEWRPGSDCNTALAYVKQKTRQKIGGYCGGEVTTRGEYTTDRTQGLPGYQASDKTVNDDYVNKLSTYAWANVNVILKDEEARLQKEGWKRVYAEYDLANGTGDGMISHHIVYKPGISYTILGAVTSGNARMLLVDGRNTDDLYNIYDDEYAAGEKMIISDFHSTTPYSKIVFANLPTSSAQTNGGMLVYSRPVNIENDFDKILASASDGFKELRARATKDPNGVPVWVGAIGLGVNSRTIYESAKDKKMVYLLSSKLDNPDAAQMLGNILKIINNRSKEGTYTAKEGTVNGIAITEIYDKNKKQIIKITSSAANNTIKVFFFE